MNAVLFIFNTDLPNSLVDALTYCARRHLPWNLLGINFGTTPSSVGQSQILGTSIAVQTFMWNGVTSSIYNGRSVQAAVSDISNFYAVDGLILSTFTPLVFVATQPPWNRPLPASLARVAWNAQMNSWRGLIANGRLGSPASMSGSFSSNVEMTTHSGAKLADQAVLNAIAAEGRYNKGEPHLLSTATSYGSVDDALGIVGAKFGFDVAYHQALMSYARTNGMSWTIDLGLDYRFNTAQPTDFALGSMREPVSLRGMCSPVSFNAGHTLSPGAHPYSNNYVVRPGGWSCHWYSYQWAWSMDFLFNGGSAAVITVDEPLADGIRDPRRILENLMAGKSMMETIPLTATPRSCPTYAVNASNYPDCVTVLGDPLYRPYAVATRQSVGARFPSSERDTGLWTL